MTFEEVIQKIAESIASEQLAISKLLTQEADKIQLFIDKGATADELVKVNTSVKMVIEKANELEEILKAKLEVIIPYINMGC